MTARGRGTGGLAFVQNATGGATGRTSLGSGAWSGWRITGSWSETWRVTGNSNEREIDACERDFASGAGLLGSEGRAASRFSALLCSSRWEGADGE
jgi:hypothetical protein